MTAIEWADLSWNPVVGCSVASPGCAHCYAMGLAPRLTKFRTTAARYLPTVRVVHGNPVWTGELVSAPDPTWQMPLKRKKPSLYFANSMGDLFHESMPAPLLARAFEIMGAAPTRSSGG